MSKPKCIAFDYIDSTDEYEECFNPAVQPSWVAMSDRKYCAHHWQNLKINLGQVFLKPAKNMPPVPSCINEKYETYECSPYPQAPRSPRSPYSPRAPASPRTPYNARRYDVAPGSPLRRAPASPRGGAGYPSTPRTMYSGGAAFDPIDPHKDDTPKKATGCRDNSCVTTGREIKEEILEKNKKTEKAYDDELGNMNFKRLIRSAPDFVWSSVIPDLSINDKLYPDYLHTIDTTKDVFEALQNIRKVREGFENEKINPNFNWNVTEEVVDYAAKKFSRYMYNPDRIELLLSFLFAYESRDLSQPFSYYGFKFSDSKGLAGSRAKIQTDLTKTTLAGMQTRTTLDNQLKSLAPREDPMAIMQKKINQGKAYGSTGDLNEMKKKIAAKIATYNQLCKAGTPNKTKGFKDFVDDLQLKLRSANDEDKIKELEESIERFESENTIDVSTLCEAASQARGSGMTPTPGASPESIGKGATPPTTPSKSGLVSMPNELKTVGEWKIFATSLPTGPGTEKYRRFKLIVTGLSQDNKKIQFTIGLDSRYLGFDANVDLIKSKINNALLSGDNIIIDTKFIKEIDGIIETTKKT